jgi:hypothetical protein
MNKGNILITELQNNLKDQKFGSVVYSISWALLNNANDIKKKR